MQSISFTDFEIILHLRDVKVLSSAVFFTVYLQYEHIPSAFCGA